MWHTPLSEERRTHSRHLCEGAATPGLAATNQGLRCAGATAPEPLRPLRLRAPVGSTAPKGAAGPGGAAQDGGGRSAPPRLCTRAAAPRAAARQQRHPAAPQLRRRPLPCVTPRALPVPRVTSLLHRPLALRHSALPVPRVTSRAGPGPRRSRLGAAIPENRGLAHGSGQNVTGHGRRAHALPGPVTTEALSGLGWTGALKPL